MPHAQILSSAPIASMWPKPAVMVFMAGAPTAAAVTLTGKSELASLEVSGVELPSRPPLNPHARTEPSVMSTAVLAFPADRAATPDNIGMVVVVVVVCVPVESVATDVFTMVTVLSALIVLLNDTVVWEIADVGVGASTGPVIIGAVVGVPTTASGME